jgi:hypothetical protein
MTASTLHELSDMHLSYIQSASEKSRLDMDWRIRKIWPDVKHEEKSAHTKETIAIEYLLYQILQGPDTFDYFEF